MNWRDALVLDKVKRELPKASDELLEEIRVLLKAELTKRKEQRGSS